MTDARFPSRIEAQQPQTCVWLATPNKIVTFDCANPPYDKAVAQQAEDTERLT